MTNRDNKRPDSSQNFWKNNQNLAFNETMKESVSLGFIRVKRESKIAELRGEIQAQCVPTEVPREYIFLKSVGRALTRVRAKQEQELKVKNFIPPQTLNPEIFLLEGRHEDFKNTPTTYRVGDGFDNDSNIYDPFNSAESPFAFTKNIDPSHDPSDYDDPHSRSNKNGSRRTIQFVDPELEKMKDLNMLKEEQERLKNRQAELENMRNRQMELEQQKKQQADSEKRKREAEEEERRRRKEAEEEERRRRKEAEEDERRRRREAEEEERRRKREAEEEERRRREAEQRRIDEEKQRQRDMENSATKIQSTVRGFSDRQKVNQKINNIESIEGLKEQLEATRRKRNELELLRDELIRHLKLIHSRITIRRKEARDLWKKKYFAEKKKTPALEEKIQAQLSEIDSLQKKMFSNMETDVKNAALGGYLQESEMRNNYLSALKLQEEIYSYKRQVDQAKLKLTTDIKLRNQAETESKALRTELHQTKINMNQLKNHSLQSFS